MHCPLCGGPLHVEDPGRFVSERRHDMDDEQVRAAAANRVATALWMAIDALESQADALRVLSTMPGGRRDGHDVQLADEAERDARVLRDVAGAHMAADGTGGLPDG